MWSRRSEPAVDSDGTTPGAKDSVACAGAVRCGAVRGELAVLVRGEGRGHDPDVDLAGCRVGELVYGVHGERDGAAGDGGDRLTTVHHDFVGRSGLLGGGVREDAVGDRALGVAGQVGRRVDDLGLGTGHAGGRGGARCPATTMACLPSWVSGFIRARTAPRWRAELMRVRRPCGKWVGMVSHCHRWGSSSVARRPSRLPAETSRNAEKKAAWADCAGRTARTRRPARFEASQPCHLPADRYEWATTSPAVTWGGLGSRAARRSRTKSPALSVDSSAPVGS